MRLKSIKRRRPTASAPPIQRFVDVSRNVFSASVIADFESPASNVDRVLIGTVALINITPVSASSTVSNTGGLQIRKADYSNDARPPSHRTSESGSPY